VIALYAAMPAFAAAAQLVGGRGERVLAAAQVVDLGAKRLD
jgi:hypothetical protein